jgi:hypothetical protein
VFGLTACSSEEDVPSQGTANDTYFELTIGFPQEVYARSTETTDNYDQGIEREYQVNKVSLFFFDADDNQFVASKADVPTYYTGSNFAQTTGDETYKLGVGYTTGAVLIQKSENLIQDHNYHVYALANVDKTNLPTLVAKADGVTGTTETEFLKTTMSATTEFDAKNKNLMKLVNSGVDEKNGVLGMPMSSRGYYQGDDATANNYTYADFKYAVTNNKANPVKMVMYLERAYGRITLSAANDHSFTYPLWANEEGYNNNEVIGTITIEGYKVINKTLTYNTFRQVGNSKGEFFGFGKLGDGATASDSYLMTPTFTAFSADYSAATANSNLMNSYNEGTINLVGWTKLAKGENVQTRTGANDYAILDYPAENAMERSHQVKGYTTGILMKARITPDVKQISDYKVGADIYGFDGKLYSKLSDIPGLNLKDDATNYRNYGVTKYPKGYCYYLYYVRHNDNLVYPNVSHDADAELMGDMEFAIVRSNTYDLAITGFYLTTHTNPYPGGKPVPDYDPDKPDTPGTTPTPENPDPETPYDPEDEDGFDPKEDTEAEMNYMNVNIVVRPWIVRGQQVIPIQ